MLSDLLSQQFCWLTFSHWITNSVNCGRASHTNEKQGTAVLFASQKPGCLQWFLTQPSSSREFTAIIITAVYIPPQANTDQALRELYGNISEQETTHPDAAFIITGNFNKANFRTIAPKYFQHVTINTRGDRILDHCYTSFRDAYKSLPRPPFGKSDHSSVLLLPAYRQKLKCEAPALRTVQCWSDQSDAILQDCFDHVDWDIFRAASDDDRGVFRYGHVFHQEVYRGRCTDKNNPYLPQPKTVD